MPCPSVPQLSSGRHEERRGVRPYPAPQVLNAARSVVVAPRRVRRLGRIWPEGQLLRRRGVGSNLRGVAPRAGDTSTGTRTRRKVGHSGASHLSIAARLREREEGQGLVEYVVLIALIALTLFAAILFFSDQLGNVFSEITNIINDALPN